MPNLSCTLPAQGHWTTSHSMCTRTQLENSTKGVFEEETKQRIRDTKRYVFLHCANASRLADILIMVLAMLIGPTTSRLVAKPWEKFGRLGD